MRKLSKKISMLMVLAMLVSLFSGIVSASAASAWSFYDRTADVVVERNATYVMEKDQYANFDLYKDEAEASTKEYKYTWYSSDADVVYVDSTNGRLRAQKDAEAGEKAFIYVLIDNKATEKNENAKRGFYIEIAADEEPTPTEEPVAIEYKLVTRIGDAVLGAETLEADKDYTLTTTVTADGEAVEAVVAYTIDGAAIEKLNVKEGEYTVVVTATIDGEVVATEEYAIVAKADVPEIVSAKQTALNTVEITFNDADWAKDFSSKVKLSYLAGDIEIEDIYKSAVAKEEVVTITLYSNLAPKTVYKFAHPDYDCVANITGIESSQKDITSIKIEGGKVPQTTGKVTVKLFVGEVDVTTEDLLDEVEYKSLDEEICAVYDGDLYFYEVGKSAPIEVSFNKGWNDEGEELGKVTCRAVYEAVAEYAYSRPQGYAVGADGLNVDGAAKLTYSSNVEIAMGETLAIYAKYTETKYDGTTKAKYIIDGVGENGEVGPYTFTSLNDNIVWVDADGNLTPVTTGNATIVLKTADDKAETVGSVRVTVKEGKKLNSFSAKVDNSMLTFAVEAGAVVGNDGTKITVAPKDQRSGDYTNVTYTAELTDNLKDTYPADIISVGTTATEGKITLTVSEAIKDYVDPDEIKTITFWVKAKDANSDNGDIVKSYKCSVRIKNITGVDAEKTEFKVGATTVDTKLNKKAETEYEVKINLAKVCKDGFELGNEALRLESTAVTAQDVYSVVISKGNDKYTESNAHFDVVAGVIVIKPVIVVDGVVKKLATGDYKIQLFKGVDGVKDARPIKAVTLKVVDTTEAITVEVKKNTVTSVNPAVLEDYLDDADVLKFVRNGNEISNTNEKNYIEISDVVILDSTIEDKCYVKSIKVNVNPKELNGESTIAGTYEETVTVNKLFRVE